jgi:hypothetical protein
MMEVVLEYRRVVDKSTGRIVLRSEQGEDQVLQEFEEIEYAPMLTHFAEAIRAQPVERAVIQRTDRAGLVPFTLDDRTFNLFRDDPVAAIMAMSTPTASPSTVVKRVKQERTPILPSLRIGTNTLADSFGDVLFCRFKKTADGRGKAECPACGIWVPALDHPMIGGFGTLCINPKCRAHNVAIRAAEAHERWVGFYTKTLLTLGSPRYFLPRAWNPSSSWISWEDLNEKYTQFQKEKESCP